MREGLAAFRPEPHRNALVAVVAGVSWVDDSKATNPHAAAASLATYDPVVWVAGGLLKGADVDDLVRDAAPHLRAAVLLGTDRAVLRDGACSDTPPRSPWSRSNGSTLAPCPRSSTPQPAWPSPGTPSCSPPPPRRWTASATTAQRGDLFAALVRARA